MKCLKTGFDKKNRENPLGTRWGGVKSELRRPCQNNNVSEGQT